MSSTASGDGERDVECVGEEEMLSPPAERAGVTGRATGATDGLVAASAATLDGPGTGPAIARTGPTVGVLAPIDGFATGLVIAV